MMANETFRLLQPLQYHHLFLESGVRADGRTFQSFRPVILNSGSIVTANGSALVKLGNTCVVAGIVAELNEPKCENPDEGILSITVELPPICSSKYRPGHYNNDALVLTQMVNNVFKNEKVIDLSDLCVVKNKLVWHLKIEARCLGYDGNVMDATLIAVLAALKSASLSTVDLRKEGPHYDEKTRIPINISSFPIASTFTFIDGKLLADANAEEESIASSTISVIVNADTHAINLIHKSGSASVSEQVIEKCIEMAINRSKQVKKLILNSCDSIELKNKQIFNL